MVRVEQYAFIPEKRGLPGVGRALLAHADPALAVDDPMPRNRAARRFSVGRQRAQRSADKPGCGELCNEGDLAIGGDLAAGDRSHQPVDAIEPLVARAGQYRPPGWRTICPTSTCAG